MVWNVMGGYWKTWKCCRIFIAVGEKSQNLSKSQEIVSRNCALWTWLYWQCSYSAAVCQHYISDGKYLHKKLFSLYRLQCKGDIVVVDIKQHKSRFNNSNFAITQSTKFFWHCVMVMFEVLNCDLCCFISTTMMSLLHCSLYKLNSSLHKYLQFYCRWK